MGPGHDPTHNPWIIDHANQLATDCATQPGAEPDIYPVLKTLKIHISWLLKKPADQDPQWFQSHH